MSADLMKRGISYAITLNGVNTTDKSLASISFDESMLHAFAYQNNLGEPPRGIMEVLIKTNDLVIPQSGTFGIVMMKWYYDAIETITSVPFFVQNVSRVNVNTEVNGNLYRIEFRWAATNGEDNPSTETVSTGSKTGTSDKLIADALAEYGLDSNNLLTPAGKDLMDAMPVIHINETVWERLSEYSEYSHIENDVLTWAFNEIDNTFFISSLRTSFSTNDLMIEDLNAAGSPDMIQEKIGDGGRGWHYLKSIASENAGDALADMTRPMAFANATYGSGQGRALNATVPDNTIRVGYSTESRINAKLAAKKTYAYGGTAEQPWYNANEMHNRYLAAQVIRGRIMSSLSETRQFVLYNTMGPSVGSCVMLYEGWTDKMHTDIKLTDTKLYFVVSKTLEMTAEAQTISSASAPKSTNQTICTLTCRRDPTYEDYETIKGNLVRMFQETLTLTT